MKRIPTEERVLIVEEHRALAESIGELLKHEGYEVVSCARADGLEDVLKGRSFDLALVDIGANGAESYLQLVPTLRRLSPFSELVLITSDASLHAAMEAMRSGAHAYLPKPFDPEDLLAIARRALAQVALKRERQALSERLALSEALYRGVVETVDTCILGIDAGGVITFANRFASQRLAAARSSLAGRTVATLVDARGARLLTQALSRAGHGQPVRDLDLTHPSSDGVRTVRWSFTPLHTAEARLVRRSVEGEVEPHTATVLGVGQDITDRLALERRSAASHAMAAIGALTTNLAHEIRNPLNAAKLQLEIIRRRAQRAGGAELVAELSEPTQLVRTEIERLSTMLDEFLSLARASVPVKGEHAVAGLVDAVLLLESPEAERVGVRLRGELHDPHLTVSCDPEKLKQVLLNLVRNSIDAMSARGHGEVVLSAEARDAGVALQVVDDGPGLKDEMRGGAAFEAFATTKAGGTGLGLSIVRQIISQHDGRVELTSRPEGGVAVQIWLPHSSQSAAG